MRPGEFDETTRRSILKAVSGALATGVAGGAAARVGTEMGGPDTSEGHNHDDPHQHATLGDIEQVGYHSLGGKGQDAASNPHYGGLLEFRVQNGLGFVSFISSRGPTPNRGFAILDVSDYTEARDEDDLDHAEIEVLSFARDDNSASAAMDIKVTDDANYAVVSREPVSALFDDPNTNVSTEGDGTSAGAQSLQLYDVSDPTDPVLTSQWDTFALGPHNAYVHNIAGRDYVFAIGYTANLNGLFIFEINRTTGQLELVNKWAKSGNLRNGGGLTGVGDAHDVTVIDDPKTGKPYVYFGMWSSPGMQVLDASDPTNLQTLGYFEMNRAHYVQPFPTLINGKRLAIAAQETIDQSEGSSGKMFLVDCDRLDESGESNPKIGHDNDERNEPDTGDYLDKWEWADPISFQSYYLGPHNADVTKEGWVHLGHYHGGTMFFEVTDDFTFAERGSFKPGEETPMNSRLQNLQTVSPFVWSAVEKNGLSFISDINSGVYVARHDDIEVGSDTPVGFDVQRSGGTGVLQSGGTTEIGISVDAEVPDDEDVELLVRDRVPASWSVETKDAEVTAFGDYRQVVETEVTGTGGERNGTFSYVASAPAAAGEYRFGPVEYSTDGGRTWTKVNEAVDDYFVVGSGL